jgi:hypothetical protein
VDSERQKLGQRVQLPNRNYLLCPGPVSSVLEPLSSYPMERSPNLWWPRDRAWCVVSEIDLQWSYVGGPFGMIEELLDHGELEVLPVDLDDPTTRIEDWVDLLIEEAITELMRIGTTTISTSTGTVTASFVRPKRFRAGEISVQRKRIDGRTSGGSGPQPIESRDDESIYKSIRFYLSNQVIAMAES